MKSIVQERSPPFLFKVWHTHQQRFPHLDLLEMQALRPHLGSTDSGSIISQDPQVILPFDKICTQRETTWGLISPSPCIWGRHGKSRVWRGAASTDGLRESRWWQSCWEVVICMTSQTYWAVLDLPIEGAILELSFSLSFTQVCGPYLAETALLFLRKSIFFVFEIEGWWSRTDMGS